MRKRFVSGVLVVAMVCMTAGCGKKTADIIEAYSEEASVAGASRDYVEEEAVADDTKEAEIAEPKLPDIDVELYDDPEAYTIKSIKAIAEEYAPDLDVTGCDTFTQIIDNRFTTGMGYANENILDEDVFFVSSATFTYEENLEGATDAALYIYKDDEPYPYEIGKVISGGTAYPLTLYKGYLYTASNRWICKYAVSDHKLRIMEKASVCYGPEETEYYFYESEDGGDYSNFGSDEAKAIYDKLFEEMANGTMIPFSTVR